MKKPILSFALFLMMGAAAYAQAPQRVNYQGVARNASGSAIASASVSLRLSIHDITSSGTVLYQETHTATTNAFGLYNVAVGSGTVSSGTFNTIDWATGAKYMEVEIDPAGGTTYTSVGSSPLLSSPYSLYANTAGNGVSGGTANQVAKFTGTTALGSSMIFDNGTAVGLNTTTPSTMAKFNVSGAGTYGTTPYYQAGIVADGAGTMANASGVYAEGGWRGVYGRNPGTSSGSQAIGVYGQCEGSTYTSGGYGVKGDAIGTGPFNYGVYGTASGGTTRNYGVYGTASGTSAYAGWFAGNVNITGSIAKGSGTFKIDHPMDPENKYLYHSFVESPDMMNIYNGNTTTNAKGEATVTLPEYFEALNKDFRYQLTVVGTFAQAIISEKVNGNHFKIKTDKPGVEVSWQVTGIRHDKYADAHRVVPEVNKEAEFKGYYLHAAEWGMPASKSIDVITNPATPENNSSKKN